MAQTNLHQLLAEYGQSPWLDNIRRGMLTNGEMQRYIDEGIVGVTANPTIFEKAIGGSTDYDSAIEELVRGGSEIDAIYESVAIQDIQDACDMFRPIWERTDHVDGRVSLEVLPELANDTAGTITQAADYWRRVDRPNLLVKIPATAEGVPAIEESIYAGISINVTLIFGIERYRAVMEAYLRGLERRADEGLPIDQIASVASFFVSRVDTLVDKQLQAKLDAADDEARKAEIKALMGLAAVANAKLAYAAFQEVFQGARWEKLAAKGAKVQRPLWASTGTKNPAYSDVLYIDELIGPDTVNTMPPQTIAAFVDHGELARTVDAGLDEAQQIMTRLAAAGIDMDKVTEQLETEGVASFSDSFTKLRESIEGKRKALRSSQGGPATGASAEVVAGSGVMERMNGDWGQYGDAIATTLRGLAEADAGHKIWAHDPTFWSSDEAVQAKIKDRLGWLSVASELRGQVPTLQAFAEEVRKAGFKNVIVLGMGGSSLCAEVFGTDFTTAEGFPELYVLDSTDPERVLMVKEGLEPRSTLYIVSSKSGGTTEPNAMFRYFWHEVQEAKGDKAGENFIAITDPGTSLEALAKAHNFRRIWTNPADIGGRYSVLSYFGLVPAVLMGVDLALLLDNVKEMEVACAAEVTDDENPALWLGAALGTLAKAGRDKATFIISEGIEEFGPWAEQLIAESTGKQGTGVLPVEGEPIGPPEVYGEDRVFIYLKLAAKDDMELEADVQALADAGHPVITLVLDDVYDLGGQFFLWEMATAVMGHVLGINPFDEPNVTESKNNTMRLLDQYRQKGRLPEEDPTLEEGMISLYGGPTNAHDLLGALATFLAGTQPGDYLSIQAYLNPTNERMDQLEDLRCRLRDNLRVATTLGYGPRFLHSTGQFHKGGPNRGVFVQITADEASAAPIPDEDYSFAILIRAQALGDLEALRGKDRRVIRLHLAEVDEGLAQLQTLIQ